MKVNEHDKVLLAHGGGGQLSDELIRNTILPLLSVGQSGQLGDAGKVDVGADGIYLTTDSYVVKPLFFRGGDIGKLAVCGTINDLAVAGARPAAISLSLIVETGLDMEVLERVIASAGIAAKENNVAIVTGDTKTVEKGAADQLFINTAGVGVRAGARELGFERIEAGDKVLLSGSIGDHGLTIICQREGMDFQSQLCSDCASVSDLTCSLLEGTDGVKFMRDPTRGGLAATLNEISRATGLSMEIDESKLVVNPTVWAAADMLGMDVLNIANEGKFAAIVAAECAQRCLEICREHRLGGQAELIGEVVDTSGAPMVEMLTRIGGRRIIQMPYGRDLPRIC